VANEVDPIATMVRECLVGRLRVIARVVNGIYEEALRAEQTGLRVGQMNLLVTLGHFGEASGADLGRAMRMDKSTLSRDVAPLIERGLVETVPGSKGRPKPLRLTAAGREVIARSLPAWREAQRRAAAVLGDDGVGALHRVAGNLWAGQEPPP